LGDGDTLGAGFTCADEEILDHIRDDGYEVTHHASTQMQYTIQNRPERERRIAEALDLAEQGMIERVPGTKALRLSLKNGGIHRSVDKTGYRLLEFKDYELTINLAQTAKEVTKNELDMTFAELRETLRTHTADDKERRDTLIEFHRRFSLPFACIVFALVGVPLGIQNQRSGKASGFSVSIGVILVYYVVLSAGKTLGQKGLVHPAVAVWAPDVVFLLLGAYLVSKTALEQRIPLFDYARELVALARGMAYRRRSGP
jgi:lipopolysaccharide export system permease protein